MDNIDIELEIAKIKLDIINEQYKHTRRIAYIWGSAAVVYCILVPTFIYLIFG